MQRTLIILRHGKSSWTGSQTDHQRPLDARGRRAAAEIGGVLARLGWLPQLIFASDAERTRETTERLLQDNELDLPVWLSNDLYLPRPDDMIRVASRAPAEITSLMLVGHNPACEEVIERLTGERVMMKTANAARLELSTPWSELLEAREGSVRLQALLRPAGATD